jgi:type II secretory ATPase GspE/PulE/Tfp pilus assembly ATPase PilB-like protein
VNIAIGQRLVRKICTSCRIQKKITPAEHKSLLNIVSADVLGKNSVFFYGKGCDKCNHSGYRGRIGIHEVMTLDNVLREAVLKKVSASELRNLAIGQGMTTMIEDGFEKAQAGITTLEEVLRMLYE